MGQRKKQLQLHKIIWIQEYVIHLKMQRDLITYSAAEKTWQRDKIPKLCNKEIKWNNGRKELCIHISITASKDYAGMLSFTVER